MADQGLFQGSQHCKTLLAYRREIASNAAESLRASRRAKTAGEPINKETDTYPKEARVNYQKAAKPAY